jgi:hypothetical protein
MLPMSSFVDDFPMSEAEKFAIFNSIGLVDDATGFAGEWRVGIGTSHGSTVGQTVLPR